MLGLVSGLHPLQSRNRRWRLHVEDVDRDAASDRRSRGAAGRHAAGAQEGGAEGIAQRRLVQVAVDLLILVESGVAQVGIPAPPGATELTASARVDDFRIRRCFAEPSAERLEPDAEVWPRRAEATEVEAERVVDAL